LDLYREERARQPIFNVPGPVLGILLLFVAVHLGRMLLSERRDLLLVLALAFIPSRYTSGAAAEIPGGEAAALTSFITHLFVHGDYVHLAMNSIWFLAFAPAICKRLGWWRFYAFFLSCGIAGALLFLGLNRGLAEPVVGASGAIAGLMGAAMRFLIPAIDRGEGRLLGDDPGQIPLLSLAATVRDRRILTASAVFLAINVLAIVGFGSPVTLDPQTGEGPRIAWEAHVGGYLFGLLAFGVFDCAPQRASPNVGESEEKSA